MNVGHQSPWPMAGASQRIVQSPFQTVRAKEICLETYEWVQRPSLPNEKWGHSLPSMNAFMVAARQNIWNSKRHCKTLIGVHHAMRDTDTRRASKHIYFLKGISFKNLWCFHKNQRRLTRAQHIQKVISSKKRHLDTWLYVPSYCKLQSDKFWYVYYIQIQI